MFCLFAIDANNIEISNAFVCTNAIARLSLKFIFLFSLDLLNTTTISEICII